MPRVQGDLSKQLLDMLSASFCDGNTGLGQQGTAQQLMSDKGLAGGVMAVTAACDGICR
jgi:hypothetical protein